MKIKLTWRFGVLAHKCPVNQTTSRLRVIVLIGHQGKAAAGSTAIGIRRPPPLEGHPPLLYRLPSGDPEQPRERKQVRGGSASFGNDRVPLAPLRYPVRPRRSLLKFLSSPQALFHLAPETGPGPGPFPRVQRRRTPTHPGHGRGGRPIHRNQFAPESRVPSATGNPLYLGKKQGFGNGLIENYPPGPDHDLYFPFDRAEDLQRAAPIPCCKQDDVMPSRPSTWA